MWYRCEGSESRKNILDGARLNPKHCKLYGIEFKLQEVQIFIEII